MVCTDRLRLRLLQAKDAVPLREVLEPELGEAAVTQAGNRSLTQWAMVLRDSGAVVGFCGFFVRPVKGTTMGYGIVPEYRGLGLATEAAGAVLNWAERHDVDVYARSECGWSTRTSTKTGSGTSTADSFFPVR